MCLEQINEMHVWKEQLIALDNTEHSKQRNLIWTSLWLLVPLMLVSLFIKGGLSSHPQDWNETQTREVAESTTRVPCQAQIECLASANSLLLLFSVPSRVAAVCVVLTGYEKPNVSKDSAYVKYMSLPPAGITLFYQTEIAGRKRLCPVDQLLEQKNTR